RYRLKDGIADGSQPTLVGHTDGDGRYESTAPWPVGSRGGYTDERYAVGSPDGETSVPLAFTVLPVGGALQPPTAFRPAPFPNYLVGDPDHLVITTDPVQAHQPVFRYRLKDGVPDGAQPTVIGFTSVFGRLEVEEVFTTEAVGNYTQERFAVGSPDGLRSDPRSFAVADGTTDELSFRGVTPTHINTDSITVLTLEGARFDNAVEVFLADTDSGRGTGSETGSIKSSSGRPTKAGSVPSVRVLSVAPNGRSMQVEIDTRGSTVTDALELLVVKNHVGEKAQPLRLVGDGPIVDAWTPSVPVRGESYALTLIGKNLATASVQPPPGASVHILTRTDTRLTGVMTVSPFAPLGFTQMAISANGETVTRPMVIVD
ncbi:MAG: hypothetical protein MI919_01490, partial [Holophagales bacterium]|nr:hypothetical protein [Holophagales bacterium]